MMYIKTPDKASFKAILYDFHFVTKEIQHFFSILSQKISYINTKYIYW